MEGSEGARKEEGGGVSRKEEGGGVSRKEEGGAFGDGRAVDSLLTHSHTRTYSPSVSAVEK
jgi:hypothetical protein